MRGGTESRRDGAAVSPVEVRDLGEPEAVVTYPLGATYQVRLAGTVVSRHVLQAGWSWEAHVQDMPFGMALEGLTAADLAYQNGAGSR